MSEDSGEPWKNIKGPEGPTIDPTQSLMLLNIFEKIIPSTGFSKNSHSNSVFVKKINLKTAPQKKKVAANKCLTRR